MALRLICAAIFRQKMCQIDELTNFEPKLVIFIKKEACSIE